MEQILTTKLFIPPLRSDLVPRPQLSNRLNEGSERKLTLVSATAGFGKSTLVSGWLTKMGIQPAWFSLDEGDNDPVRFWTYLIAAIQTIQEELGIEARQIVSAPQLRTTEPVVISLINDISQYNQDLILVLDDYHVIEAGQIHNDLSYLLGHQPPNLHLILITRVDPPLSFARLRAYNQLVEIRAGDLQFSTDEAEILFNDVMRLDLKPEQVEALNWRAEGWIVGLNLAGLTLKGKAVSEASIERFTKSHQFILDYLTEEVLEVLPNELRQFLLRTSILDRFCAALCTAVTDNPGSQQVLDELHSDNLFLIPLDSSNTWFRYHHLFAEVLYSLLERDHPDEISALHLKAAAWFESAGYPGEAVDHALRSGDMRQAKELILSHWIPFLHRGELVTVLRWLDALPEDVRNDDPFLSLARCWVLFLRGQGSAIGPNLEQANKAYERLLDEGALSSSDQDIFAAQLAMMRSVLARSRGEHTRSVAYAEEAARLIPTDMLEGMGTQWNMLAAALGGAGDFEGAIEAYGNGVSGTYAEGNLVGAYGSTYGQVMYMMVQGRLKAAEKLCRSAIQRAVEEGNGEIPAAGWLYIAMARIEEERYRLDKAEAYLESGLRIARRGGFGEAVRSGRYLRAHLAAARGDMDAADKIFRDMERIVDAMDDPYLTGELNREWARFCLKAGDLDVAREKLQVLEKTCEATQHAHLLLGLGWLSPRLLCAEERFEEALIALEEPIRRARSTHSKGELIRLLALQAIALNAIGDQQSARSVVTEALGLGAPEGYIWRWLDGGPGIEPLLRTSRGDGDTSPDLLPYVDSLLEACRSEFRGSRPSQSAELPDPLTPRELEIMRLICNGYSNPEIADQLVVTTNTVKKHTSNIYSKLGVRSRTQAIARVQQLNLL